MRAWDFIQNILLKALFVRLSPGGAFRIWEGEFVRRSGGRKPGGVQGQSPGRGLRIIIIIITDEYDLDGTVALLLQDSLTAFCKLCYNDGL